MTTVSIGRLPRDPSHALALAKEGTLACERLPGDASDRVFHRVRFARGARRRTAILVRGVEPPFVETARLLGDAGVPTPEIFAEDESAGIVVEEDFGDTLLEDPAARAAPVGATSGAMAGAYRGLVDLLVTMQRRLAPDPQGPLALRRAFDAATFGRELRMFEEHLWRGHLGAAPPTREAEEVRARLETLASEAASLPRRFAHRDFHSRNLMVRPDGTLGVIDFQDARFGPPHYDLVSLVYDGYARLDDAFIDELFGRYEDAFPSFPDRGLARAAFDLTAAQRVLKALGSFGYLARAKGKPRFLEYVPKALGDAASILRRRPELRSLHALLAARSAAFA